MQFLRDFIDKNITPHVQPGEKYAWLHTTWDALDTFLFTPNLTTKGKVHVKDGIDLKRTMDHVIKALIPCLLFGMWNVGHQHFNVVANVVWDNWGDQFFTELWYGALTVLPVVITSYLVGLAIDFFFCTIRHEQVNEGYLVTGMLIPLIMPPTIPLWMVAAATAFAVIIAREAFGGTGMNLLNVALTARVFLFFAYPTDMSGDTVWIATEHNFLAGLFFNDHLIVDGYTGATWLGQAASAVDQVSFTDVTGNAISIWDAFAGWIPGSIGETSSLACLIGAIILCVTGIGSWRVMISVVFGGLAMGYLLNAIGGTPFMDMPGWYHLFVGGFAFGLVYMATDPVTASQTNQGKFIYGFLIGFIAVLIRVINPAYPEGMMLAILLMNTFAPLIDYYVVQGNIKRRLSRG